MTQHLASFNYGRLRHDWDDPRVADFADNIERVNAVAMRAPGYLWHMPEEEMDAAQRDPAGIFGGDLRIASTLSLWENVEALFEFAYRSVHGRFYARGPEWFCETDGPRYVLWYVERGLRPTIWDAKAKYDDLAANGPSTRAFDFAYLGFVKR